jgi:two-component system, cell cycle sensor histidine kinase and response regulator CckA
MARSDAEPRTILVVDDDVNVRTVIGTVLRRQTYDVLEAATGEEALRIANARGAPIQLVISDLNMPQMGGRVLLDQLRALCPSIRVLLISGEDEPAETTPRAADTLTGFLAKPFTPAQLSAAVKGLLDGPRANGGSA